MKAYLYVLACVLAVLQLIAKCQVSGLAPAEQRRLQQRYGGAFRALQDFLGQWKSPATRDQILRAYPGSPGGEAGMPGIQGRKGVPGASQGGFVLTNKQKDWFVSLEDEARASGARVKRDFRVRREYRQLSCWERNGFHAALRRMKTTMIQGMSQYDIFVGYHQPVQSPAAHGGVAFLPWHRHYLLLFENALRRHDARVSLPYWDSTLDGQLPHPQDSIIWSDRFLGDPQGTVQSGPFTDWTTVAACQEFGRLLTRNVGGDDADARGLFAEEDIDWVLSKTNFQDLHVPDRQFENSHGGPHVYVGGHMGEVVCSPTDPIFWMHHAFVDLVWEEFRTKSQRTDPVNEYPRQSSSVDIGGEIHNPDAPMLPFATEWGDEVVNKDGLRDLYTSRHYRYSPRPKDCRYNRDCGRNLFCHNGRCKSKVKVGGDCTGLLSSYPTDRERQAVCECGMCQAAGRGKHTCHPRYGSQCYSRGCGHGRN